MPKKRVNTPGRVILRAAGKGTVATARGGLAAGGWAGRHPRITATSLAMTGTSVWVGYQVVLFAAGIAVLAGVSWRVLDQPTFDRFAGRLLRAWARRWFVYQRQWSLIAQRAGLSLPGTDGTPVIPRILRVRSDWCWDSVTVRMAKTQEQADYEAVLNRLASAYRARRATLRTVKPGVITLDFQRREPFDDQIIPLRPLAENAAEIDLSRLVIGEDEYSREFALDLINGIHHLLVGSTNAGKGSWLWGLLRALAPLIRDGIVRLWVIDPKGGQEFGLGRAMFHAYADTASDGLDLFAHYVDTLDDRKLTLGRQGIRTATPSRETPLDLLICDELAAMTAWATRDIAREFEPLMGKALSQFRSVGGRIIGATQEPTKDVIPMRGLFPTKIALRVEEASYVDMAMGEGARDRGALADQISEYLPGVAYVKHEGRREPLRVRAAYTTDEDIAELVKFCTTPDTTTATVTTLHTNNEDRDDVIDGEVEEINTFDGDDEDDIDAA